MKEVPIFEVDSKCLAWHNEKHLSNKPLTLYAERILDENGNRNVCAAGLVRQVLPEAYIATKDILKNFQIRPDDVWVIGAQRSGTHLTSEMVWLIDNKLDFQMANSITHSFRILFFEAAVYDSPKIIKKTTLTPVHELFGPNHLETNLNAPSPRHFTSHLMFELLPNELINTAKVFYVARNVKDVMVSNYHFDRKLGIMADSVDFKTFCYNFMEDHVLFGPYFTHIKQAWAQRHHPNMMFLFYEDIVQDISGTIRRVCQFLGKQYTDDQLKALREHLKIDNMKNNEAMIPLAPGYFSDSGPIFIRNGKLGSWREYFDEDLLKKTDAWIKHNLADSDFTFRD